MTDSERNAAALRQLRRALDAYEAGFKDFRPDDAALMTEYRLPRFMALALDVAIAMQALANLATYEAPYSGKQPSGTQLRELIMEAVADETFDARQWLESEEVQFELGRVDA